MITQELRFRGISLMPMSDGLVDDVYFCRNQPDFCYNCSRHRKPVSHVEFIEEIKLDFESDRLIQWVGYYGANIVGTGWLYQRPDKEVFLSCYILPAYRKKILGGAFIIILLSAAAKFGVEVIFIEVYDENVAVLRFAQKYSKYCTVIQRKKLEYKKTYFSCNLNAIPFCFQEGSDG